MVGSEILRLVLSFCASSSVSSFFVVLTVDLVDIALLGLVVVAIAAVIVVVVTDVVRTVVDS